MLENEAERIGLLETTAAYVRKALDLKLQSDQLIQQQINRPDPVREKAMDAYQTFLLLDRLMP